MKLKRQPFLDAVRAASSASKSRTTLPILTHVLLAAQGGKLSVTSTDLDVYAKTTCDCEGDLAPVCVPGYVLLAALESGTEDCEVKPAPNERMAINCGRSVTAPTLPADEFPKWPDEKLEPLGVNPIDLAECIEGVFWSCDDDPNAQWHCQAVHVSLKTKSKAMFCASTTGQMLAAVSKPAIVPNAEFLLPAGISKLVVDCLRMDDAQVALSDGFLSVQSPGMSVCAKLMEGQPMYSQFKQLTEQERDEIGKIDAPLVAAELRTVLAIAAGEFTSVEVATGGKGMELKFSGRINKLEAQIPGELQPSHFHIAADKLRAMLSHVNGDTSLAVNKTSLLIKSGDMTGVIALIKPQ
jgi:DNA polymerase III subunit beta